MQENNILENGFKQLYKAWSRQYAEEQAHKITELCEKGHAILDEKYWSLWNELVTIYLGNTDIEESDLLSCLEIINALNCGSTLGETEDILTTKNYSSVSSALICSMVAVLCDRGRALYEIYNVRREKNNG